MKNRITRNVTLRRVDGIYKNDETDIALKMFHNIL